ncbi:hypothetical protein MANES_02G191100v8 [Manihot esculenta]|uniref:Uncharacterized protein n=2 Tax=Manihot esculenta TaxID=3983 RepID=A0A2C9WFB6_MANES|nr:hypothetical protein MANES_02G191100v8 [Manihot esculenta]
MSKIHLHQISILLNTHLLIYPPPPMATEDFSFPTFTDTTSSAIDSPPLWRLSPAASPDSSHTKAEEEDSDQEDDYQFCFPTHKPTQRKSFSWVEHGGRAANLNDEEDKEEKMDMLWEDFNEELSIKRSRSSSRFDSNHHHLHRTVNMGRVHQLQSLRSSNKTSSAMVSPRKNTPATSTAGFVVFMKVLKKLFLLHNSHQPHISVHQNQRSRIRRVRNRSW